MSALKAHMNFADIIAHELEHIRRFKCGAKGRHHDTKEEKEAYNERGKKEGDRLRKGSKTLRLFEAWLDHLRKKNDAEKQVATAAENALNGTPVPRPE